MFCLKTSISCLCILFALSAHSQHIVKRKIAVKHIETPIKIDGELNEAAWKDAPVADRFISLRPTPFQPENPDNASQVYFLIR